MEQDKRGNKPNEPEDKSTEKSAHFTAKIDKDAQDAIFRNLYIPKLLRDKIKKPDDERGR